MALLSVELVTTSFLTITVGQFATTERIHSYRSSFQITSIGSVGKSYRSTVPFREESGSALEKQLSILSQSDLITFMSMILSPSIGKTKKSCCTVKLRLVSAIQKRTLISTQLVTLRVSDRGPKLVPSHSRPSISATRRVSKTSTLTIN